MKKNPKGPSLIVCILFLGVAISAILVETVLEDNFIIRYGVRTTRLIQRGGMIACVGISIVMILSFIPIIKSRISQSQQQRRDQASQKAAAADDGDTSPEATRKQLAQLRQEMPELPEPIIMASATQLDEMDKIQARQSRLIRRNDAKYLKQTEKVLDDVERRICRNIQGIINICIAVDDPQALHNERKIDALIHDSYERLHEAKKLIELSADWINQYNTEGKGSLRELESWLATIKENLKEE